MLRWVTLGVWSVLGALGCAPTSPTESLASNRAALSTPWELEQKLAPPDPEKACPYCYFGSGVALRGNTAVVGSYPVMATVSNAVYVYVRGGNTWSLQGTLEGSDVVPGDDFGGSTAVDGDTVVVGANQHNGRRGAAYVFNREGGVWTQQQKLTAPAPKVENRFGWSVAVSGDTVLVRDFDGVHVYVRNDSKWSWQQTIVDGGGLGNTLALEGNTALLSTDGWGPQVWERSGSTWSFVQTLTCSDGNYANYGDKVALSGDTALASAYSRGPGAAYVFTRSDGVWTEQQKLTGSDSEWGDYFGQTVSLSGDIAIAGSFMHSDMDGQAYIFQRSGGVWTETQRLTNPSNAKGTEFGGPSAIDGDRAIFAAWVDNDHYGGAYIFRTLIDGGKPCSSDQDCAGSAVCGAEAVCCDSECAGPCQSCLASVKGSGDDGVCGFVSADTDPDDHCAAGDEPCGPPGVCDGAGACRPFAAEVTPCGETVCDEGAVSGFLCDGAGACVTSETECAPFSCKGNACAASCADDSECATGMYCTAKHRCALRQDNGTSCGTDAVCKTGFCVDGVCCESECSGQCEACGEQGELGTCIAVEGKPRGNRSACSGGGVCGDGEFTYPARCDGEATDECTIEEPQSCDGYQCDESGCLWECTEASHCAAGFTCDDSGTCASSSDTEPLGAPEAARRPPDPEPEPFACSFRPRPPAAPPIALLLVLSAALAARRRTRERGPASPDGSLR